MTNKNNLKQKLAARPAGFFLIEVLISVFILLFMALMFAAVVPTSLRSVKEANYYRLAGVIAQRKIDQLMDPSIRYANLNVTTLTTKGVLSTAGSSADPCEWFDPNPIATGTGPNAGVAAGKTYQLTGYFTKQDGLRKYQLNGSLACQPQVTLNSFPGDTDVTGRMDISGWQDNTVGGTNSPLLQVTITITWRTPGHPLSTYRLTSLVPKTDVF